VGFGLLKMVGLEFCWDCFFIGGGMGVLRIGVLGCARIARGFVSECKGSGLVEVVAVASRDLNKARGFAAEFGVARAFGSYEELLACDSVDTIYNPLPNGLHAHWSILAARAGKHVLCEKPLAANHQEAVAMFAAAREHGVKLAEAYPYLAQPQTIELRRLIAQGVIGKVRIIQASFGFRFDNTNDIRYSKELAGGAMMDAGCYPLSLIRILMGKNPTKISALGTLHASGVDTAALVNMQFDDGAMAQLSCSFETGVHRYATIGGEKGAIQTSFLNTPSSIAPPELRVKAGLGWDVAFEPVSVEYSGGFRLEAESFARWVAGGEWSGATEQESLDIARLLDLIHGEVYL
jgi:D-xylose 1-dehydrogenase (NADP+, D-xylono-1,5-lactone-forming)